MDRWEGGTPKHSKLFAGWCADDVPALAARPQPPSVTVAIHQPNYLPWLGYFDKILRADVFVLLDCVQLSVQSYTQRARILCQGKPLWLTVPIQKSGRYGQAIRDTECQTGSLWARKHLQTLQASYGRHPYYEAVAAGLRETLAAPLSHLAVLNQRLIEIIATQLGARCRFVRASDLGLEDLHGSELLSAIVQQVGGTTYLFGGGATNYQDEEPFERRQVALLSQQFAPRPYPQRGIVSFVAGLSIVDALFNVGYARTRALLGGGLE